MKLLVSILLIVAFIAVTVTMYILAEKYDIKN
jgi:hypothetical protein